MTVPIADQIACVERELRMRARVYPGWIAAGRMTREKADAETRAMEAVLMTLRSLAPPQPQQGSLLP